MSDDKLLWGNITWKFFHTLAEKVKEDKFFYIKDELINLVVNTCANLPCPDCSEHANSVLKRAYLQKIHTKDDFKQFLRQFHNIVNIKLNKNLVSKDELDDLYKNTNLDLLLKRLVNSFLIIKTSERLMNHNFNKKKNLRKLVFTINNLRSNFE